jgi:hypothetical protein
VGRRAMMKAVLNRTGFIQCVERGGEFITDVQAFPLTSSIVQLYPSPMVTSFSSCIPVSLVAQSI